MTQLTGPMQRLWKTQGLRGRLVRTGAGSLAIHGSKHVVALASGIVLGRALGAEGYGTYAFAVAIMNLLLVGAEVGVPTLLLREVAASRGRGDWRLVTGALVRSTQLVGMASVAVAVVGSYVLWRHAAGMAPSMNGTMLIMMLVLPLLAMFRTVIHALYGLQQVVAGQALEMVMHPLLVLSLIGGVFFLFPALREPQFAMASQLIATAGLLLAATLLLRHSIPRRARIARAEYRNREWAGSLLPFMFIGAAGIINNQASIIVLGWYCEEEAVGIYRVGLQAATLVALGMQAATAVAAPHLARMHAQGDTAGMQRLVAVVTRAAMITAMPVALILILYGGPIASLLFGPEFLQSHTPMALLAVATVVTAAAGPLGLMLNMTGHERDVVHALWKTALINISLGILLVPEHGPAGAATATALSTVVLNGILLVSVRRKLQMSPYSLAFRPPA